MADRKAQFIMLLVSVKCLLARRGQFFATFNILIALSLNLHVVTKYRDLAFLCGATD